MAFANSSAIGNQPLAFSRVVDTTQNHILGAKLFGVDSYWGGATFMYGKAGGTIAQGNLCSWDKDFTVTATANTANTGAPCAVAISPMTTGQYGWFGVAGQFPVSATASVAAGVTFGLTGAGTVGAVTNGKQILSAVSVLASTGTVVKAGCSTITGSAVLRMSVPADGWFYGMALSGTGIAGGATIAGISDDLRTVTMSANATATGSVSVTGTYTGFIKASINFPFVQGQVT